MSTFYETPLGRWLVSAAEGGILKFVEDNDKGSRSGPEALDVLDGNILRKLQKILGEKLNLDKVRKIVDHRRL